jgi:hypothetical protein
MLKLLDKWALAIAKQQQDVPLLHELVHASLAIEAGKSREPLERQT